ncbi:hypothetical protein CYMTET_44791 [Cymbomonas tetramitiformis]|uniref:PX domain-containing protein n=1 Tax=Cymbomonas tetramitiformis TaxID=36881 RepID=A0AAE0C1D5_9CHLO|nr:hypothetical protein CYMTET_44791 [Cymbomonas tetramitiformis]
MFESMYSSVFGSSNAVAAKDAPRSFVYEDPDLVPAPTPVTAPSGYEHNLHTMKIEVSKPELVTHNGMTYHVIYHIQSWTTLPQYASQEVKVYRRYSDFEWLRGKLRETFPGVIIPHIPEKVMISTDLESEEVQDRLVGLQLFVAKVAIHPLLRTSADLQKFLESGSSEIAQWHERGTIGDMLSSFNNMFETTSTYVSSGSRQALAPAPESTSFDEEDWGDTYDPEVVQEYLLSLNVCLAEMEERVKKIIDMHELKASSLLAFSQTLIEVASTDSTTSEVRPGKWYTKVCLLQVAAREGGG